MSAIVVIENSDRLRHVVAGQVAIEGLPAELLTGIDLFGCSHETSRSEAQRKGTLKTLRFTAVTGLTLRRWLLSLHPTAGVRAGHHWGGRVSFGSGHHPTITLPYRRR